MIAPFVLTAFLLAGLLPPTPSPPPPGIAVGKVAPEFYITGLDGREIGGATFAGRPLIVNVFATWNAASRTETAMLAGAYGHYKNRIAFIGIDRGEPAAKVAQFVHKLHVDYPIGIDPTHGGAPFTVGPIPHTIGIDKHGIVRSVADQPLSRAALDRLVAQIAQ